MRLLVIHGPNLNMLGRREPGIYGTLTLPEIDRMLRERAAEKGITVETFQSNHEGEIIDRLHAALDTAEGIIINPGAYTHYAHAIADAIRAVNLPTVEVHLSNVHAREEWRHRSVVSPVVLGTIAGFGAQSYLLALEALHFHLMRR